MADDRVAQNASVLLDRIVRQGRAFGIHVILGSQTLGGAYTLARTTFAQLVVRIALQCDEADSYLIMDESNAAPSHVWRDKVAANFKLLRSRPGSNARVLAGAGRDQRAGHVVTQRAGNLFPRE